MNQFYSKPLMLLALSFLCTACNRNDSNVVNDEPTSEPPSNRVDIPSTVRDNLGITFAKTERRNLDKTIRVPGNFELQPLARHEYRLMLSGVVEFAIDQFEEVNSGTVLYHFRSAEWLEMQAKIGLASASLDQARSKYEAVDERVKALRQANFKRADLEARLADLSADLTKQEAEFQVSVSHATRILNLCHAFGRKSLTPEYLLESVDQNGKSVPFYQTIDRIEVRAIEPGIVESLAVTDGVFVEDTTLILTTVDPTKIRFRATGLQSDLPKFQNEQQVRIVPPQAKEVNINETIEAELKIGLEADPNRRTMTLFATPKELKSWTKPGVSAFLEIATETTGGIVLAIPLSAVVKDGLAHVFFKRDPFDQNKAIRVEADLGVDDGRWIEVKSEVGPNDEVVLNGAYELKLATATSGTTQKGGHFHADGAYHGEH